MEDCNHPVRATDFLGALTNTDWHCTVCGEYVGPQSGRSDQPPASAALKPLEVFVRNDRVWIARGHQSFLMAWEHDKEHPEETELYAENLRRVLLLATPLQLETLMPKDMSEAKRIITQLYGELSTTKALLNAELQRNKGV